MNFKPEQFEKKKKQKKLKFQRRPWNSHGHIHIIDTGGKKVERKKSRK